ncbi:MAG: RidA family protein [Pirellulales bacterium]|nr:RidA family protein [Pirellulales bacterium]
MNRTILIVSLATFSLGFPFSTGAGDTPTSADDFDQRLAELGYELPPVAGSVGIYKSVVVVDNMAYLAGHIPRNAEGEIMRGKVGESVTLEQAQAAARRSGLAMLASLKAELGTLNRVKRLVKTTGMVNCTADFVDQPKIINGCSQLFKDLFGDDRGVGARATVGMNSLPAGAIVEIEAIFELEPTER